MNTGSIVKYNGQDLPEYRGQDAVIIQWIRFGIYRIEFSDGFQWDVKKKYLAFPTNARMHSDAQGLTKREVFAKAAMQALLSSIDTQRHMQEDERYTGNNFKEVVAVNAIEFADELLRQLEK
jgi:hypothetical protein